MSRGETRTAALFPPAVSMLERLGAWASLDALCAPLSAIRLVDATGHLLRAPEVVFSAADIGHADLGRNVPNEALCRALAAAGRVLGVEVVENGRVEAVEPGEDAVAVELAGGRRMTVALVVAADGRNSIVRRAAGIDVRRWRYDQSALACSFAHSRPHRGVSTELHGTAGPCTTVPLPGNASSLVWMDRPAAIERVASLTEEDFLAALAARLGGLLGTLHSLGPRRVFPLEGLVAERMGARRVALVGEAAHALPPIGAQGLNLGLVDAAVLADLACAARRTGEDIGSDRLLAAYSAARVGDVRRRVGAVDLLNRSLEPMYAPLGLARGAGLHVLAAMPALRRRLMLEGLYPPAPIPSLMRGSTRVVRVL